MKPPSQFLVLLVGIALAASPAHAAIDSFTTANGTVGPNTPPALNSSFGTVDVALNLGQSAVGTLAFGGITFTNNNVSSATNTVTWATVGGISVGATTDVGATWSVAGNMMRNDSAAYNEALSPYGTEAWGNKSGGLNTQTINITGLDAGRSYLIQLMHGEDRSLGNGFDYIGTLVATGSDASTGNTTLQFGDENDSNAKVFGLVTLEVSGVTGVDILYPERSAGGAGSTRDPSLAGIVISSVAGSAPVVTGRSPADNATNVAIGTSLVMTFNETVQKSTGNIYVRTGGSAVQTIAVTSPAVTLSTTTFPNDTVTVDISDLTNATDYAIRIDSGAIEDSLGNDFSGITNDTDWNFQTVALPTQPVITSVSPLDGANSVPPVGTDLVITFDETVVKGTGSLYVRTGGSAVQTIDVTTAAVTLSTTTFTNDTVTVDISDLANATDYAIQIDAGAFEDTLGADFAGIGDDTTWNFSTGTPPPSSIVSFSAVNGTTGPNTPPTLDNTYGTLELALNLGGGSITYDGIGFTGNTVTSGTNVVTWATVGGISVGGTTDVGATWNTATNIVSGSPGGSGEYNATYGTEAWSNKSGGGAFQTINVTGLDPGKSYQIQLMHGEDRSLNNGLTYTGTLAATAGASPPANVAFSYGDDGDVDETVFGLVTLVVSGTTNIDITYPVTTGDRDPSIAGIVIHSATGGPTYASWAATHAGGGASNLDFDNDGVSNGVEYFMNITTPGFTANPALNGSNTITWPNGGNIAPAAYGTEYVVQTSGNLVNWTDVPSGSLTANTAGPGGSLTYTLTGTAPRFVRLKVTPN